MSDLPLTRQRVSDTQEQKIRDAVRSAKGIGFSEAPSRLALPDDAEALCDFLSDPEIHAPIYNLPQPLTVASVRAFIEDKLAERERGEGLLLLRYDEADEVVGYSEFDIWPEWGAGDLGGALRADRQGQRAGVDGARRTFDWMYDTLNLQLIVATGALDNIRTARLLDGLGFERKGEITSHRPDGSSRQSMVWEISRDAWKSKYGEDR